MYYYTDTVPSVQCTSSRLSRIEEEEEEEEEEEGVVCCTEY